MAADSPSPAATTEPVQYNQFGTFGGVFTPSILTILGVIMFLRTGSVVGEAGIMDAILILTISNFITFLTGLSISAISTNTRVKGGGAYFLISRSLGPEFGGAIGLALFLAQALSVPFYILGFVTAIAESFPSLPLSFLTLGIVTTVLLFVINYVGSSWAIRAQYGILGVLVVSILVFLIGALLNFSPGQFESNWVSEYSEGSNFWSLFAIFFPAVTGILTGVNMSGDLKDPALSIPRGTLYAIGTGFIVYLLQILVVGGAQTRGMLIDAPYTSLLDQALFNLRIFVIMGVLAATLSSALGSFMGAPRILQALARDGIFPSLKLFGKGTDKGDEPQRAMLLTFIMTLVVLVMSGDGTGGSLNAVATILTMFFLYTYGMTNLAAFTERFSGNPSFRPRFRYFHWMTALIGGLSCFGIAVLINPLAALAAGAIVLVSFAVIRRRVLKTTFGDARRGFFYDRVRSNLRKLATHPPHPKNWRPTSLVLSGHPEHRLTLTSYAVWFESGRGIATLAQIIVGDVHALHDARKNSHHQLANYIEENQLDAYPKVVVAPDLYQGVNLLIQSHAVGPLEPNLVVMGWPSTAKRTRDLFQHVNFVHDLDVSQVFVCDRGLPAGEEKNRRIDVWWRGNKNGSLMLVLAYLLTLNWGWRQAELRLLRLVSSQEEHDEAQEELNHLLEAARIKATSKIVVGGRFSETLQRESHDATVVFLGFQPPTGDQAETFFEQYSEATTGLPTTMLICSCGEVDLTA